MKFVYTLLLYIILKHPLSLKNPQVSFQGLFGLCLASSPRCLFSTGAGISLGESSTAHCVCAFTELKFTMDKVFFLLKLSAFFQRASPYNIKVFGIQSCITFLLLCKVVKTAFTSSIPKCQIIESMLRVISTITS